jgi:predicted O-methyltransferase YrrM
MPFYHEKFARLKKFTDKIGIVYGTEDFSIYLYSIVKMSKPKNVLELGTGFGTTSLWIALALEENQSGILHTVDDGSEWNSLNQTKHLFEEHYRDNYVEYIKTLFESFDLKNQIVFHHSKVEELNYCDSYDIVFSDFSHSPYFILKLIAQCLVKMNENSYIFIDSASTYYPSFQMLNDLIKSLNTGQIPKTLLELVDENDMIQFKEKIRSSRFELKHIIENKNRNQNSTAEIRIFPIDIMPQPRQNIRF